MKSETIVAIILFCLISFLLTRPNDTENIQNSLDPKPNKDTTQSVIEPEENSWMELNPVRNVTGKGRVLNDIESQLGADHPNYPNFENKITQAHEATHAINFWHSSTDTEAIYVLNNRMFKFSRTTNITLKDLAEAIPHKMRTAPYQLYLIDQQRDYNDHPDLIFDEWSAYTNGAQCRESLMISSDSSEVLYMIKLWSYSTFLFEMSEHQAELSPFMEYNTTRCFKILSESSETEETYKFIKLLLTTDKFRETCKKMYGEEFFKDLSELS